MARDGGAAPLGFTVAGRLLYALPEQVLDGREHQIEFVVTEGLDETLRERLAFQVKGGATRPAVEVLALHPGFRASLLADRTRDASIAVHLDGTLVEEVALSDLSRRTLELAGQNLSMVGVQAAGRSSAAFATLTPYGCVWNCEQAWRDRQRICERFPRLNCEEDNDRRLTSCLQSCGCPVAIREVRVDTTYAGDLVPPQLVCLRDGAGPFDGHFYDRRNRLFRRDHYNDVVYCDGIHRIELGSVDYTTDRCIQRNPQFPLPCRAVAEAGPEARCQ